MSNLSMSHLYKIGYTIDNHDLRGKRVWWTGKMADLPGGGGQLAVVRFATTTLQFKEGDEWQVRPYFLVHA